MRIPRIGAPGCVLIVGSLLLGLFGLGFTVIALGGLWRSEGSVTDNLAILAIGTPSLIIAVILGRIGLKRDEGPQSLQISRKIYFEAHDGTGIQPQLDDAQEALEFTPSERGLLQQVEATARHTPSADEVMRVLNTQRDETTVPVNELLKPIAFSIKPTSVAKYVKGVFIEALTWIAVVALMPFILLSGAWGSFRTLLAYALRWSKYARQYRVRPHNVLLNDKRAPIVYLRSFSDDFEGNSDTVLPTTSEEKLVHSYNRLGPVIAIGRPGEALPLLGASRLYFDDATWQAGLLYLISICQLVVVQAGIAPGLLWELTVSRLKLSPEKLLISFTAWEDLDESTRQLHYLRFKKYAERLLECQLPPNINETTHITFAPGWVPAPQSSFKYSIPSVRQRRKKMIRFGWGISSVALGVLAIFFLPSLRSEVSEFTGWNRYKEDPDNWKTYTVSSSGMSLDLPGKPEVVEPTLFFEPFGLEEHAFYSCAKGDLITSINYGRFSDIVVLSAEKGLEGSAADYRRDNDVSDLTYATRKVGIDELALDGQFKKEGTENQLRCHCWVRNHKVWSICVSYSSSDGPAGAAATHIFDSVRLP